MSKDTITVNMNVYDIPILVEQLNKLEQETQQLKNKIEFLELSNPEQNIRHWEIINENRRKIGNLRKQIKDLKELEKEHQKINGELREEIKELEERVKTLKDTQLKQLNIIQQRDGVIEKVREYTNDKLFDDYTYYSYEDLKQNINEILDKVEEN